MNKLVIGGIVFVIALLGVVFMVAGGQNVDVTGDMVNLYSAIAAVVIVVTAVSVVLKYVNQMQNDTAQGELADHEWDGIGEYKNELPTGWAVMYIILLGWFIYYVLVAFPLNAYSQIGEYNEEVAEYNKKFGEKFAAEVAANPDRLLAMGKSVFNVNCAPCHGVTADGLGTTEMNLKAANLTHRIDYVTVKYVLENGSNNQVMENGFMPDRNGLINMATGMPITDEEIEVVSHYVGNNFTGEGAEVFANVCSSCHGDGSGIDYVAPNLKNLTTSLLTKVIAGGKKGGIGTMPAFQNILNPTQLKAVAAYVASISKGAK